MFYWGASSSAHQTEGGNDNDWTVWEKANAARLAKEAKQHPPAGGWPEYILTPPTGGTSPLETENYVSGRAAGHYEKFREDFELAASLAHNAHRFSIEWSRIEPVEGQWDEAALAHYHEVLRAMRGAGLEPFLSLWHWTLPKWLADKGGVRARKFLYYFERYVEVIARRFGDDVQTWITLNEPEVYALNAYGRGIWPPEKHGILSLYRTLGRLIRAHRSAYRVIKKISPGAQIGTSLNWCYFESAGGLINDLLEKIVNRVWNEYVLRQLYAIDFIGLNYYFHSRIKYGFNKNENRLTSDMGWEIYPDGLYHLLHRLHKYHLPIYVTENGLADLRDRIRGEFITNHVAAVNLAREEGVDVRGYFYWALTDNFEWDKGFWPRFGLIEVDYKTMKRKVRPSALTYKELIQKSR
jgi:beta-glucosidase